MKWILVLTQFLCGAGLVFINIKLNTISNGVYYIIGLFLCYQAGRNFQRAREE